MSWSQLAWKARPTVVGGDIETIKWLDGELEIPRKGYLDATEMQGIRDVDPSNLQIQILYRRSVELAARIGDEESWNSPKCYALLCSLFGNIKGTWRPTEEEARIIVENEDLVKDAIEQVKDAQNIVRTRTITVILRRNTPDWTDQMTTELPGHLQDLIYEFANTELTAGMGEVDLEKAQRQLEDDLKKLPEEMRSILSDPTSLNSSGNAENYGPAPPSLAAKTTARSLGRLSSKRSKRASRPKSGGFTKRS